MQEELVLIANAIVEGESKEIAPRIHRALAAGVPAEDILNSGIIAGLKTVGQYYQNNTFFLSDMLSASKVAKKGISTLRPYWGGREKQQTAHQVIIGTVEGDLHDVGKDLVSTMLKLHGFDVIDLGVDVSGQAFLQALEKYPHTEIVCLSALLTATMPTMGDIVAMIRASHLGRRVKIMVGGAPVTRAFAACIHADGYSADMVEAIQVARQLCGDVPGPQDAGP